MAERGRRGRGTGPAAALVAGLAVAAAGPPSARADSIPTSVLLAQSTLVINQQSNAYAFTAPGPGTLTVTLDDLVWPTPLQNLSFSIDSPQSVLGWVSSAGEITLSVAKGGTYYADVSGQAAGSLDLGLYSLAIDFRPQEAPVPLPATLVLMLCGIGTLVSAALVLARNESVTYAV